MYLKNISCSSSEKIFMKWFMYFRFIIFYQYFVSKVCGFDLPNWLSFTEFVYKKNRANFQIAEIISERMQTANCKRRRVLSGISENSRWNLILRFFYESYIFEFKLYSLKSKPWRIKKTFWSRRWSEMYSKVWLNK